MLSKLVKFVMWSTGIVATAVVLMLLFVSNFNGYCDQLGRVTTDRELILAAIEHEIKDIRKLNGELYANAEEYLEMNPNCCEFNREYYDKKEEIVNRFIGWYIVLIYIKNVVHTIYPGKEITVKIYTDSCGNFRERYISSQ